MFAWLTLTELRDALIDYSPLQVFNLYSAESVRVEADMEPKRYGDKCLQSVEKVIIVTLPLTGRHAVCD